MNDLVTVWLVGLDGNNLPTVRATTLDGVRDAIGAAQKQHRHVVEDVAGLSAAITGLQQTLSLLVARVAALESTAESDTYSQAVKRLLQSADEGAMRSAMGISGIQLGEFGQHIVTSETVGEAYVPIEEYLAGRANG